MTAALADVREQLKPYYSEIGRPSVDPELMIRMLIVGYCYGLRSERKLTQEVELHLAYRWFCRLDLDDKVPHHSTFSENRLHRFRESDVFRHIFERVVAACMAAGLVKGEGFAVDASVMEANASRYHGKAPDEIAWAEPERQTRAVKEYLAALEAEAEPNPDRPGSLDSWRGICSKSPEHDADHGEADECSNGRCVAFEVASQATVTTDPRERSFDDPPFRQHLKSSSVRSLDDLQAPGTSAPHRHRHLASRVSAVGKNAFDERE